MLLTGISATDIYDLGLGTGGAADAYVSGQALGELGPGVPNGQPVKGRLTAPPNVPVTKSTDGKPVAETKPTRWIVVLPKEDETQE